MLSETEARSLLIGTTIETLQSVDVYDYLYVSNAYVSLLASYIVTKRPDLLTHVQQAMHELCIIFDGEFEIINSQL